MAQKLQGTVTLRQALQNTRAYVPNRFDYRDRDVIKRITIQKVTQLSPDRPDQPIVRYEIRTYSYPQYKPYINVKGKKARKQRTIRHEYDTVLTMDRLSIDTKGWKMRVGSGKDWEEKPPQKHIKQIYKENRKRWNKRRKEQHKKKAPYLDVGDYNSRVKGLNGDFVFRLAYTYWKAGHYWGNPRKGKKPSSLNPGNIVFLPKHAIHFIEMLMIRGILKRDY